MRINRLRRAKRTGLTTQELLSLLCGPALFLPPTFANEKAMREAWAIGRDDLLVEFGHACWAFWYFELQQFPRPDESNLLALLRLAIVPSAVDRRNKSTRTRGTMTGHFPKDET